MMVYKVPVNIEYKSSLFNSSLEDIAFSNQAAICGTIASSFGFCNLNFMAFIMKSSLSINVIYIWTNNLSQDLFHRQVQPSAAILFICDRESFNLDELHIFEFDQLLFFTRSPPSDSDRNRFQAVRLVCETTISPRSLSPATVLLPLRRIYLRFRKLHQVYSWPP